MRQSYRHPHSVHPDIRDPPQRRIRGLKRAQTLIRSLEIYHHLAFDLDLPEEEKTTARTRGKDDIRITSRKPRHKQSLGLARTTTATVHMPRLYCKYCRCRLDLVCRGACQMVLTGMDQPSLPRFSLRAQPRHTRSRT
jgi:hypothetical protein